MTLVSFRGGVRCMDCTHRQPHKDLTWMGTCAVGERSRGAGGLHWSSDRKYCERFRRAA